MKPSPPFYNWRCKNGMVGNEKKYKPKIGYNEVKLKRDFNISHLDSREDLDAWIIGLLHMKRRLETMGTTLSN